MKINKLHIHLLLQVLATALFARADLSVQADKNAIDSKQGKGLPIILKYSNYLQHFKRTYIDPLEIARKAKLFLSRTMQIFQHNTQYVGEKTHYYLAQNEFTDSTPEELAEALHVGEGGELEPIAGSDRFPDLPANNLWRIRRFGQSFEEGFSSSSLDQMRINTESRIEQAGLDFTSNLNDRELREAIEEVRNLPEPQMRKFGALINLKHNEEITDDEQQGNEERQVSGIEHKAIVESNNKDYNPLMTPSYGVWEEFEILPEHYTRYGLNDIMDDFNLDIYPKSEIPDHKVLVDNDDDDDGFFSGLMDSLRNMCHGFDGIDELLEDEWVKIEKPRNKVVNYDIDWRKTGCISRVKTQKSCNSCYAFSVVALMEYFYCRQTKSLTDFSAQYIIDCGVKNELRGCKGGKIINVGRFIRQFGIELEAMYPYDGAENSCPIEGNFSSERKIGYLRPQITKWQNFPDIAAWYKWLPKSPLIVGINMPADFLAYGGGVHDGSNCQVGKTHAMLLVGSGKEDDREFWLLKNSYSETWGENGYFRLSKSAPARCFNAAIVVRADFVKGT